MEHCDDVPFLMQLLQSFQSMSGSLKVAASGFNHDKFLLRVDFDLVVARKEDVYLTRGCFDIVEWSGSHDCYDTLLLEVILRWRKGNQSARDQALRILPCDAFPCSSCRELDSSSQSLRRKGEAGNMNLL